MKVQPLASWKRGGLHVTAIELANKSNSTLPVDHEKIKGQWLASSVENDSLAANGATYLYLVSVLSFDETIAEIK